MGQIHAGPKYYADWYFANVDDFEFRSSDDLLTEILSASAVGTGRLFEEPSIVAPLTNGGPGADSITSGNGNDTHSGLDGNDTIKSGGGTDTIFGDAGNDSLDGQSGADSMTGGTGNDTFVVDSTGDKVIELSAQGIDTVKTSLNSYALANNVENLVALSTSGSSLVGNNLNNAITGNIGNDTLNGGIGNDSMTGSAGNDTYRVDSYGDVVSEGVGTGTDTVVFLNDFTWTGYPVTYIAPDNIENLTGGSSVTQYNLVGNNLNNVLTGNNNGDSLTGGAGNDTLKGGLGNDVYTIESAGDLVVEIANEGWDTVMTSLSTYVMATNVEELQAFGGLNGNFTGNGGNNAISVATPGGPNSSSSNDILNGGAGNDTLNGGLGNDTITGGTGADIFSLGATPGSGNIDTFTDFKPVDDTIWLNPNTFSYGVGNIIPTDFKIIGTGGVVDASDRIIYDQTNGKLYYDSDGSGATAKVQIAVLTGAPVIDSTDIFFI